uniref:Uncharacterized protein n=1 Tax=Anguilla anguilla TaxID=7936 RepID=A0A0E9U3P7_ANGAN
MAATKRNLCRERER